ncbi:MULTISPECIES: M24 family metallopeptidase [unclassified Brenneria]|uniref:M24 family metallopeptidase n=1 Tax=unclassified Brenneria TaxID=2634434 RepID=UPI00155572A5|nr:MULTISPECIES: Xaa-Pro peptidase family protein [unclassified Brenneria]MBJ7221533.1 aminopeptidase P family protein [Brenneria sp. L3-3C-1]MEE3642775.1 Xaa-Pro peptidase family protein [Brenneria sp. L3_3C_1]MEE3651043.1 Xaa-Pro peptidase family protein [Brenneria sp. HEZEL_4_2_4]NPD00998.1 aminopeptidase P family protein [Brenneria sp. hezel4-2-4]
MNSHQNLIFSLEEYHQRVEQTRSHMRAKDVDLLLIDQTEFLFYLTGFGISENMYRACLLPLEGEPVMVFRAMDEHTFQENSWITDTVTFADWQDPIDVVVDTIVRRGWEQLKIGVDFDSYCMTLNRFNRLQRRLATQPFRDFSGVLERLRECKTPREIDYISAAARVGDIALSAAVSGLGVGKTERDAAAIVHQVFMQNGLDSSRYGIITSGVGNSFLHGNLHDRPLATGDIVHMELLPILHGYHARLMRPAIVGRASQRQQEIAEQLIKIQDAQFAAMRPGALAKDIDALARDAVLAAGLREDYVNITGYTLGYYSQSTPHTSDFSRVFLPNAEWRLKPDMVFHMYIYAEGLAFSETIAITGQGYARLTRAPRQLFIADSIC